MCNALDQMMLSVIESTKLYILAQSGRILLPIDAPICPKCGSKDTHVVDDWFNLYFECMNCDYWNPPEGVKVEPHEVKQKAKQIVSEINEHIINQ